MNLSNLKPAWQQLKLETSMQRFDPQEILLILEKADGVAISKTHRYVMSTIMFIALIFCCQGG
jgi:hypothetical protein